MPLTDDNHATVEKLLCDAFAILQKGVFARDGMRPEERAMRRINAALNVLAGGTAELLDTDRNIEAAQGALGE